MGLDNFSQSALSRAQSANSRGIEALQAHDSAAAIAAFREATDADPGACPLWINLAHAYRLAGDVAGERVALEAALSINRIDFVAQLRMAQLHQRLGHEVEALQAWQGVRQLVDQFPRISPALAAELEEGESYCQQLRKRLEMAATGAISIAEDTSDLERRRITAFVDTALGRRRVYHNECAGLHYPFLPEDEYFDRDHFPWISELEAGASLVADELRHLLAAPGDDLRPYVRMEAGTPSNKWSSLDGSPDWSACFLWEFGEPNYPVLARCPHTAALLEQMPLMRIPGRAPNVFFSLLAADSHIPPHTGVTNTRAIVHLALDVPGDCWFRVGNETRTWVEGKAFAFDDTIEHEAWNRSQRQRAVLILDVWNPYLTAHEREAVSSYFMASTTALK